MPTSDGCRALRAGHPHQAYLPKVKNPVNHNILLPIHSMALPDDDEQNNNGERESDSAPSYRCIGCVRGIGGGRKFEAVRKMTHRFRGARVCVWNIHLKSTKTNRTIATCNPVGKLGFWRIMPKILPGDARWSSLVVNCIFRVFALHLSRLFVRCI